MKKRPIAAIFIVVTLFLYAPALIAQSEDAKGCTDYPKFSRIPGYRISECIARDFDTFSFPVENRMADDVKKQEIEGKYFSYSFDLKKGEQETPSLLVCRSLENDLKQNGGFVVARVVDPQNSDNFITGKIEKDNFDTWILIRTTGGRYHMNIIEKHRQVHLVTAEEIWSTLEKKDTVTLDIFFDDDTTTIIPASLPIINQISMMMKDHPALQLSIQCHTDSRNNPTHLKMVSAMRAKVVLDAITAEGIEKKRMTSLGWGGDHPVADNKTEEGRAKNRRIVLVKKQE
jgi:OmpA-OmpF porin, OOP family